MKGRCSQGGYSIRLNSRLNMGKVSIASSQGEIAHGDEHKLAQVLHSLCSSLGDT